jgi:hypothetical protein
MEAKRTCPECHLSFEAELPPMGALLCPLCDSVLSAPPSAGPILMAPSPPRDATGRQVLRGVVAVGMVLFLAGGLIYAYHLMDGIDCKAPPASPPAASPDSLFRSTAAVGAAGEPDWEDKRGKKDSKDGMDGQARNPGLRP